MAVAMRAAHGMRMHQQKGAQIFTRDFSPGALFAQQVRSILGDELAAWEDAFGQIERIFQAPVLEGESFPRPTSRPLPTSEAQNLAKVRLKPQPSETCPVGVCLSVRVCVACISHSASRAFE